MIVSATMLSCHRIHGQIMWAERQRLQETIERVRGWHAEAQALGALTSGFVNEDALRSPGQVQISLRVNPINWAETAAIDLPKGEAMSQAPAVVITAETSSEDWPWPRPPGRGSLLESATQLVGVSLWT
jgi:hypothetical protein